MAAGDLTDLATCYIACDISGTPDADTQQILGTLISALSAYVPQALNRNILADNYLETYTGNGKDMLLLRQRPVLQVSSISWQGQTVTAQGDPIVGTSGCWTDGRNAGLVNYFFPQGVAVRVAYSAGYITVPKDISLAVAGLVAEEYQRRTHVGEMARSSQGAVTISFDPRAMHAAIQDRLQNYRLGAPC
jgi:hypothetical protein